MKKVVAILLSLLYLGTSTGATIHVHYCMGKLAGWGVRQNEVRTCGNCGMEKVDGEDNGCCKDEHKFLKNVSDQKFVETAFQLTGLTAHALIPVHKDFAFVAKASVAEAYPASNAPPRSSTIAAYILNRTFLV